VARLTRLSRLLSLCVATGLGLSAQTSPWDASFKFSMGNLGGQASTVLRNNEILNTFAGTVEVTYRLDKASVVAFDFGYRFFPGTEATLSYIPATLPANSTLTALARKDEAKGFQFSALYRKNAFMDGMSWQAGLRMGQNKVTETDTGSRITTNATPAITRIDAIASSREKKILSIGGLLGLHYQFTDQYSGELNLFTTKMESPTSGKVGGSVVELSFGVRF